MDPQNALWHHSRGFILNPMCSSSAPKQWKKTTRPKACAEHWTVNAFVQLAVIMTWKWSVVCLSFQKLLFLQSCSNAAHCCTWSYYKNFFENENNYFFGTIPVELINSHCWEAITDSLNAPSWVILTGFVHQRWQVEYYTMPWSS